ncbi:MAG: thiamine phosphate synthase [Duncaniella sp.]|nr:thiamine phosphate synthase [Duncaniella sp.]
MKIFYITPESPLRDEAAVIRAMIEAGTERVHLRHPRSSLTEIAKIVEAVPVDMRGRLMLHDFHREAKEWGCGVHLNSRNPSVPAGYTGPVSRSCHSLGEVADNEADYCLLSPFFDSISKPGYRAVRFEAEKLMELLETKEVVALGGVTPERFAHLRELGFRSAALSGYLTGEGNINEIIKRLRLCFNS